MSDFYDRAGQPIDFERFIELLPQQRVVVQESASTPTGEQYRVSTIWLGLDHAFGTGVPTIFETMPFGDGDWDLRMYRWPTESAARFGHQRIVDAISSGVAPDDFGG